ncbi:Symplekin tight junction protein C terminal-domain-containing protein [Irpex rosettiformis]|uniref:Symplekin tight junction protein C terminal-domain-containing protein n=1 Tax=Irpex rosettiformis TaxID=378272 RepID=A0ACB8UBB2_9APHY|nr:Symplekin tight junction protein C terminal-domain-containing protein [Irpex rosettiformis]
MASAPFDPLKALSAALGAATDSKEQADVLNTLREHLEAHPSPIPVLCSTLISTLSNAGDSVLRRWVLDLLHFAICRANLSVEARTQLAAQSLEALAGFLNEPNLHGNTVKVVVQIFGTIYPLIFRHLCTNRALRHQWEVVSQAKARILNFAFAPQTPMGVKVVALKFVQRVILVQTRGGNDPRLQDKNDPNISMCPSDHPFISIPTLESEGHKLLEGIITMLYSSKNPDVVSAIVNSCGSIIKLRPVLIELIVSALTSWTPSALAGSSAISIRSVEKSIRILMTHIMRQVAHFISPHGHSFAAQIQAWLPTHVSRMEKAAQEEKQRRAESRKRPPSVAAQDGPDAKRAKLEDVNASNSTAFLAAFDFTKLPTALVTDLIVANIQSFSVEELTELVRAYREGKTASQPDTVPLSVPPIPPTNSVVQASVAAVAATNGKRQDPNALAEQVTPETFTPEPVIVRSHSPSRSRTPQTPPPVKEEEPQDPLQMDIDEEELEYEPDKLNMKLSGVAEETAVTQEELALDQEMSLLDTSEFRLPPPKELPEDAREALIRGSLVRIWNGADDLEAHDLSFDDVPGMIPGDMWMILLVRLITRVVDPAPASLPPIEGETKDQTVVVPSEIYSHQDRLRQTLCDYIMTDFSSRIQLATTWMNEEWYNDQIRIEKDPEWRPNYETWLNQIVAVYQTHLDNKDRTFSRFLLDLPSVTPDVLSLLREMCIDPDKRQVGFAALREFVTQRPTLRTDAMNGLLELTTHSDKVTRAAAINTLKRWIPDFEPMASMIRDFALQLLRRLQSRPREDKQKEVQSNGDTGEDNDENMEDGQLPPEEILQTPYLPEQLELPAQSDQILQHLELLLALSTRSPEFLDELFAAYGGMDETVQEKIQQLITPLIRALGSSHGKLLTLLRKFPPGAETLALRVLTIFTETGRPSSQLVVLVKGLISERDLDARFLIPIIAEMDKADILKYLPRIVSILNGKPEPKNLVRSVFGSIVTTPPQSFGTVTSNLPRVRQSELLTPVELMVLLHESEKEIGLKQAIEAIGVCFSMTDIFRSDILAVVMNQLVDEPVLPTLFLRTVIQAVSTYRTLVGFVSSTLLTRLIIKKVWTVPPLWEGFMRCAKLIAPASFGALLQLPKEQLRDIIDKQPSLKSGLREYVMKKSANKSRTSALLELFTEDESRTPSTPAPTTPENGAAVDGTSNSIPAGEKPEPAQNDSDTQPAPTPAAETSS